METLVVVAQHKNTCYGKTKTRGPARYGSSPFKDFRGINCRCFQSALGIQPTSFAVLSYSTPVTKKVSTLSPKIRSARESSTSDVRTLVKKTPTTTSIPVNGKTCKKENLLIEHVPKGSRSLSEMWAGPAYSNSPPPSSLPIPKFSLRPKRIVSLDLPFSSPEMEMRQTAESAPPSPTGDRCSFSRDLLLGTDSATKNLRRILNLKIEDE